MKATPKFLILRFSSIGDIVLTTPVIRCLKKQLPTSIIHFFTKKQYQSVLQHNPYIDKLILLDSDMSAHIKNLRAEKYDYIIDLHNNIRTVFLKARLGVKRYTFDKINREKFLITQFKINVLPNVHIVDRYMGAINKLGVRNDDDGLDYFLSNDDKVDMPAKGIQLPYIVFAIGGQHTTKRLPVSKIIEVCMQLQYPIVLLGGNEDKSAADSIAKACGASVFNLTGCLSLNQSAYIVQQSLYIITHDTGLMHIAAAFKKPIVSVWGNTIPQFGMSPYYGKHEVQNKIVEVQNLSCRPCSKLGYRKCPKGHFNCMTKIDATEIVRFDSEKNNE